jgi:hypothetical protein
VIWLLHALGIDDTAGPWYAFWSGFGSDIGEVAIIGGLVSVVRSMVRHHAEQVAQRAQHHREHLELQRTQHAAVVALAKSHHSDLMAAQKPAARPRRGTGG